MRRFEQVLEENPHDVIALYELGHTLMAAKEYKRALEAAMKAAEYDSPVLPEVYTIAGSCLDELGDPKGALSLYEDGMRKFPRTPTLPFNIGVTYLRLGKRVEARRSFQRAVQTDPVHRSSHYRLAALYVQDKYEVPGILACLRFLELADDTQRCRETLQYVLSRTLGGAKQGDKPDHVTVNINLDENSKKDEGDFTGSTTMVGLLSAMQFMDEGKKLTKTQFLVRQHEALFETFENNKKLRKEKKKFAAAYYAAYFRELNKAHHTEAFTYHILRQSGWPDVSEWLQANPDKVKAYADWSKAYTWPTTGKRE